MSDDVACCVILPLFDVLNVFHFFAWYRKENGCEPGYNDIVGSSQVGRSCLRRWKHAFMLSFLSISATREHLLLAELLHCTMAV